MRTFRGLAFLTVGLFGVVPIVHIVLLPEFWSFAYGTFFCVLSGLGYIMGVVIYVSRIPERLYPGKFDI